MARSEIPRRKEKSRTMSAKVNCQNCNSHVTHNLARVYGDNNNILHRCPNCLDKREGGIELLRKGVGAGKDIENIELEPEE